MHLTYDECIYVWYVVKSIFGRDVKLQSNDN